MHDHNVLKEALTILEGEIALVQRKRRSSFHGAWVYERLLWCSSNAAALSKLSVFYEYDVFLLLCSVMWCAESSLHHSTMQTTA